MSDNKIYRKNKALPVKLVFNMDAKGTILQYGN